MALIFELLDKKRHRIRQFDCGKPIMNAYIRQYAGKNSELGISRTWVAVDGMSGEAAGKSDVLGYFTLSAVSIAPSLLDNDRLPQYPTPVTLLARLAVKRSLQGKGLGKKLLLAALKKSLDISDNSDNGLPAYAVVLDVLDEEARRFYDSFEFFQTLGDKASNKLFVPMETVRKLFAEIENIGIAPLP